MSDAASAEQTVSIVRVGWGDEDAAAEGAPRVVLQTGVEQPEAITLCEEPGYTPIAAYPPCTGRVPEGVHYAKALG